MKTNYQRTQHGPHGFEVFRQREFTSFAAESSGAPSRMPNRWSRERSKGETTAAAVAAGKGSEEGGRSSFQPVGDSKSAQPHRVAFTVGQNLVEAQMLQLFASHGVQALLDLRPKMLFSSRHPWTRRDLARLCSVAGVQLERRGEPSLLAALRFSKPPTALLFAESDPRNAWRRELSDEVFRAGWQVLHVTAKFGELMVTPHQELFSHAGNAITWPPTAAAVPELQKLQWPCSDIHSRLAEGRPYLFVLPWDTELLWCPRWLDLPEADRLLRTIQEEVVFQQPVLRFSRGLRTIEAQQPRRSAWVSDQFNSREHLARLQAEGHALAEAVLEAHPLEAWSKAVFARAEATSSCQFNALLLHSYDHGGHSMGFHSDSDLGLGDAAAIASFSLGATRTFSLRSQVPWNGRRIEIQVPMHHGSFLAMGPGFQGRWLHAVLKEPDVAELRVNGTLRFYDLPQGVAQAAVKLRCHRRPVKDMAQGSKGLSKAGPILVLEAMGPGVKTQAAAILGKTPQAYSMTGVRTSQGNKAYNWTSGWTMVENSCDVNPVHVIANVEVLTKGEQRHLLDGDRLVLNLGQACEGPPRTLELTKMTSEQGGSSSRQRRCRVQRQGLA
ncbi:ALKBH3, partial [Symbiodinium microadriaticum]